MHERERERGERTALSPHYIQTCTCTCTCTYVRISVQYTGLQYDAGRCIELCSVSYLKCCITGIENHFLFLHSQRSILVSSQESSAQDNNEAGHIRSRVKTKKKSLNCYYC